MIAVPTLSVVKVDTPDELISDVITLGSLASLIVPVVILAALDRLVAVVAVPVKLPTKVVAVITPLTRIFPAVIPTPIPVAGFDPVMSKKGKKYMKGKRKQWLDYLRSSNGRRS